MVTGAKQQVFFKTRHHGLLYAIKRLSADILESCVKCSYDIGQLCLNPRLNGIRVECAYLNKKQLSKLCRSIFCICINAQRFFQTLPFIITG